MEEVYLRSPRVSVQFWIDLELDQQLAKTTSKLHESRASVCRTAIKEFCEKNKGEPTNVKKA